MESHYYVVLVLIGIAYAMYAHAMLTRPRCRYEPPTKCSDKDKSHE